MLISTEVLLDFYFFFVYWFCDLKECWVCFLSGILLHDDSFSFSCKNNAASAVYWLLLLVTSRNTSSCCLTKSCVQLMMVSYPQVDILVAKIMLFPCRFDVTAVAYCIVMFLSFLFGNITIMILFCFELTPAAPLYN